MVKYRESFMQKPEIWHSSLISMVQKKVQIQIQFIELSRTQFICLLFNFNTSHEINFIAIKRI